MLSTECPEECSCCSETIQTSTTDGAIVNTPANARRMIKKKWWQLPLGCLAILSILTALAVPLLLAFSDAREAACQSGCRGNFGPLHLAFVNYHQVYSSFPPAYIVDADGKPMHSWRVLILPFIDETAVYEEYDFGESWNGPHNSKLSHRINKHIFRCPSSPHGDESPFTDYVVVVGPDTIFPGNLPTSLSDLHDGPENTILLAEVANSNIHWMEPRDLNADTMSFVVNDAIRPSISSHHTAGPAVVFLDYGSAYRIDASLRSDTLKALTTIAGNEHISRDKLARQNDANGRHLAE